MVRDLRAALEVDQMSTTEGNWSRFTVSSSPRLLLSFVDRCRRISVTYGRVRLERKS